MMSDFTPVNVVKGDNYPEDSAQLSWSGQYKRKDGTNHYIYGPADRDSISKWNKDYRKEFAVRIDWFVD
jgi:hypothetical protein